MEYEDKVIVSTFLVIIGIVWFGAGLVGGFTSSYQDMQFWLSGLGLGIFIVGFTHLIRTVVE